MILVDTDMFSLLGKRHPKVAARWASAPEAVSITIVTQVEALAGRFAFLLRAADGIQLLRAQQWLRHTESELTRFPPVMFNAAASAEFERLIQVKGLKKVGRPDILIASIALAQRATLATRNFKDFSKVPGLIIENWAD
jgi:tRNA(fMet)-specific endonuclease VapC